MNSEYEKRLEAKIDRELKGLPELVAPSELASRVMLAIGAPKPPPQRFQPWQSWPTPVRAAALVLLLAVFGGVCAIIWQLPELQQLKFAQQQFSHWFTPVDAIWQTLRVLGVTGLSTINQLGTTALLIWAFAAAAVYAFCLGLGTAVFKFATVRR